MPLPTYQATGQGSARAEQVATRTLLPLHRYWYAHTTPSHDGFASMTDAAATKTPENDTTDKGIRPATPRQLPSPSTPTMPATDTSRAVTTYANFARVIGTPEEILLDLALNSTPQGTPTEPISVSQRIVLNYYTAKRLLGALQMTIQRHEAAFGVLETDVQKRAARRPK